MKMNLKTIKSFYLALSLAIMANFSISVLDKLTLAPDGYLKDLPTGITYGRWEVHDDNVYFTVNGIGKNYKYFLSPEREGEKTMVHKQSTFFAHESQIHGRLVGPKYIYYEKIRRGGA